MTLSLIFRMDQGKIKIYQMQLIIGHRYYLIAIGIVAHISTPQMFLIRIFDLQEGQSREVRRRQLRIGRKFVSSIMG